jgi:hypothetical protein
MRMLLAALVAMAFVVSPLVGGAADKQVTDVKELAGSWQGWVTLGTGQARATMNVKDDGAYEASTQTGTLTRGNFYIDGGNLRYRSSRSSGTVRLVEDRGKVRLVLVPEGPHYDTGPTEYERMR